VVPTLYDESDFFIKEIKGLFGRALAPLKMAPAPLKKQLLWRS